MHPYLVHCWWPCVMFWHPCKVICNFFSVVDTKLVPLKIFGGANDNLHDAHYICRAI